MMFKRTMMSSLVLCCVVTVASAGLEVRIDFGVSGGGSADPGGNWNSVTQNTTTNNLTDFNTGLSTSASVTTSGVDYTAGTDGWPASDVDWVDSDAAEDYFYFYGDFSPHSAYVTVGGLDDGKTYQVEFVSSYGGSSFFALTDIQAQSAWADSDYQGLYSSNIGEDWNPDTAYDDENWLIWDAVSPSYGQIDIVLTVPAFALSEPGYLNAMRIVEVPEPATLGLLGFGGAVMLIRRRRKV